MFTYGNPIFPRKRYVRRVQNGRSHLVYLHENIRCSYAKTELGETKIWEKRVVRAKYPRNKRHTRFINSHTILKLST